MSLHQPRHSTTHTHQQHHLLLLPRPPGLLDWHDAGSRSLPAPPSPSRPIRPFGGCVHLLPSLVSVLVLLLGLFHLCHPWPPSIFALAPWNLPTSQRRRFPHSSHRIISHPILSHVTSSRPVSPGLVPSCVGRLASFSPPSPTRTSQSSIGSCTRHGYLRQPNPSGQLASMGGSYTFLLGAGQQHVGCRMQ